MKVSLITFMNKNAEVKKKTLVPFQDRQVQMDVESKLSPCMNYLII